MLFGEYLVLEGAKCLAFPLKFGQQLSVSPDELIYWESYDRDGRWFYARLDQELNITDCNEMEVAKVLQEMFRVIRELQPEKDLMCRFRAEADFNLQWGLGSSSTLISLLSQWAEIDPYQLMNRTFGGSGYDIACATENTPILYSIADRKIKNVTIDPEITQHFLFVYLGKKQNSREEIKKFRRSEVTAMNITAMNEIISDSLKSRSIEEFEQAINQSEDLLSQILGRQNLKDRIFADYTYSVKSLGAWGGDFFLATHRDTTAAKAYFSSKGLSTMFTYNELVK